MQSADRLGPVGAGLREGERKIVIARIERLGMERAVCFDDRMRSVVAIAERDGGYCRHGDFIGFECEIINVDFGSRRAGG